MLLQTAWFYHKHFLKCCSSRSKTIPANSKLTIDARYSNYIDQDIIEFIQEFRLGEAKYKILL